MTQLHQAKALAAFAHRGQTDKSGQPYWMHIVRVADSDRLTYIGEMIVAYLHDIIEDTECTANDLRLFGFSADIVRAVQYLTHDSNQDTYMEYIINLADNGTPWAINVKLADLDDHLDGPTADVLTDSMRTRYTKARGYLEDYAS